MAFDIIVGRSDSDRKKYGTEGAILLGKQYVTMGQTTSLSNPVYMDVTGAHVLFICGKRGGGKSYTMGVIAEGMSNLSEEIKKNISIVIMDTMGVYWTMKYPNEEQKDALKKWGMEPKGLDVMIYTPKGFFKEFRKKGIPTDFPFTLKPNELSATDWCLTFETDINDPLGILIERVVTKVKKTIRNYGIDDIIKLLLEDKEADRNEVLALKNRFQSASEWGLFDKKGTKLKDLVAPGQVTVLDLSCYATMSVGKGIRPLVVGLLAQKLFSKRMLARRDEEFKRVKKSTEFFKENDEKKRDPMVWMIIDEAHNFLPKDSTVVSSEPLITLLREGRQPGISLILATQQPGKIHTDVMTQSDIVLSHRITANMDVKALGLLMQSYMREGLDRQLDNLPSEKGSALLFDDSNERMMSIKIRPRFTWHGGSSPTAMPDTKRVDF